MGFNFSKGRLVRFHLSKGYKFIAYYLWPENLLTVVNTGATKTISQSNMILKIAQDTVFKILKKLFFLTDMIKLKYRLSSFKIIQMYLL